LFWEITQGFDTLSSARKSETTLRAEKVKLKSALKTIDKKLHAIERSKFKGKSAWLAKGFKAIARTLLESGKRMTG
jgi:hypothetical protein